MVSVPTEELNSNATTTTIEPNDLRTYSEWQNWMKEFVDNLPPRRRAKVLEFVRELELDKAKLGTIKCYLAAIGRPNISQDKPYEELSREELIRWQQKILPNMVSKRKGNFHHNTIQTTIRTCLRFLRYLHTGDIKYSPHKPYPEVLKCLKYEQPKTDVQKIRRNLPTVEEAKAILEHCGSLKYEALFSVMIEVGPRSGDILPMKVGDVEFEQYGATIFVDGKTGQRQIPIYYSAPILQKWIEEHRYKNDRNAPLWLSVYRGKIKPLSKTQVWNVLQKATKRAGINKKIYPHLLRHLATATLAKKGASEALLNRIFGWSDKGKTASIYLNGFGNKEVKESMLRLCGVKTEGQQKEDETLKPKECPRCKKINPPTTKFCGNCSYPLNEETALKLHQSEEKANKVLELITRHIKQKAPELVKEATRQPEVQQLLDEMGLGE